MFVHFICSACKSGLLGWLTVAWSLSEREITLKRGLDATIYLLFFKYLFFACFGFLAYGIILIITHATAGGTDIGVALIGMGNVPEGWLLMQG